MKNAQKNTKLIKETRDKMQKHLIAWIQKNRELDNLVDTDTATEMEHDNVHDTEELEKNTNKNITNVVNETKQDDEVLDKNLY